MLKRIFVAIILVASFAPIAQAQQGPIFDNGAFNTFVLFPRVPESEGGSLNCLDLNQTTNMSFVEAHQLAAQLGEEWHVQSCVGATILLELLDNVNNPNYVANIMGAPIFSSGQIYLIFLQCGQLAVAQQCDGTAGQQGNNQERAGLSALAIDRSSNNIIDGTSANVCDALPITFERAWAATLVCAGEAENLPIN